MGVLLPIPPQARQVTKGLQSIFVLRAQGSALGHALVLWNPELACAPLDRSYLCGVDDVIHISTNFNKQRREGMGIGEGNRKGYVEGGSKEGIRLTGVILA